MKIGLTYNWIVLVYLILVSLLTLNGNISYGSGLGDVVYLIACGFLACIQLVATIIIVRQQKGQYHPKVFYLCGTIFLFIALFLSWKFTLGRGPEYSWNGNVFYIDPF